MNDANRYGRFMNEMFLVWNEIGACLWHWSGGVKSDHLYFRFFFRRVINNLYHTVTIMNILSYKSKYFKFGPFFVFEFC